MHMQKKKPYGHVIIGNKFMINFVISFSHELYFYTLHNILLQMPIYISNLKIARYRRTDERDKFDKIFYARFLLLNARENVYH